MVKYNGRMNISCIYKITSTKTGKIYVGQTHNLSNRMSDYRKAFGKTTVKRTPWMRSYLSDDETLRFDDEFDVDVLEIVTDVSKLNNKERYWISKLKSSNPDVGYNIKPGGGVKSGGNEFESVLKYSLINGSVRKFSGVYVYDHASEKILIFLSQVACSEHLQCGPESISSLIRKGVLVKNMYTILYSDKKQRWEIATEMLTSYENKIKRYYEYSKNDLSFQTQVSHLVNRITKYADACLAIEQYCSEFEDSYDCSNFVNFVKSSIERIKPYQRDSKRKLTAQHKAEYVEYCIKNNIPITDPEFKSKPGMQPVIVYDIVDKTVLSFIDRASAADFMKCSKDAVRSKLVSGAPIYDRYHVYLASIEDRNKQMLDVRRKCKVRKNTKRYMYSYMCGYFACNKLCDEKPFNYVPYSP